MAFVRSKLAQSILILVFPLDFGPAYCYSIFIGGNMYDDNDELDYQERECKIYGEFLKNDAITLELGKTYLQESSSWAKMHYKIIFTDGVIAVGLKVWCGIYNSTSRGCGTYEMFKVKTGEKYNDNRLCYRLKKEV